MYTVKVQVDEITPYLDWAVAQLGDLRPVMAQIGEILVVSTKERFKAGESPEGVKWAPKSATTLAKYGARKSNRIDRRPLFGPSGSLSRQIFSEPESHQVTVGSPMIYAAVMQFGARAGELGFYSGIDKNGRSFHGVSPWGPIPARPFLGISASDTTHIIAEIEDWLGRAAK